MSGTSLDGIDASLVDFANGSPKVLGTVHEDFPSDFKAEAFSLLASGNNELHRAALLSNRLAGLYSAISRRVCVESGAKKEDVAAIGCHGQTVRHRPSDGYTVQINNPALTAELSGIRVIADFRTRDIAAGGQGAPLVPAFHEAVFRNPACYRVVLNLGGIGNVTVLKPGEETRGFDTGPANLLLDAWARRHLGKDFDQDGQWAGTGQLLSDLLAKMADHPYFARVPPKSCGAEEFNLEWLQTLLDGHESAADVQRTLVALTALSVTNGLEQWGGIPDEIYVCGGGARNPMVMMELGARMPTVKIQATDELGLPAESVESVAFAWLAYRHCQGESGNLPAVTGASGPRILGASYPA